MTCGGHGEKCRPFTQLTPTQVIENGLRFESVDNCRTFELLTAPIDATDFPA